jgi:hypothetical protein
MTVLASFFIKLFLLLSHTLLCDKKHYNYTIIVMKVKLSFILMDRNNFLYHFRALNILFLYDILTK